jgi:hypothetical protein
VRPFATRPQRNIASARNEGELATVEYSIAGLDIMKSQRIDQLQQQSELTRRRLDQTLQDLRLHLSPSYQLHRTWNATKNLSARTLRRSGRWADAHPLAVLAFGATLLGAWYLIARRRKPARH